MSAEALVTSAPGRHRPRQSALTWDMFRALAARNTVMTRLDLNDRIRENHCTHTEKTASMASLTIRKLDPAVKENLRRRAARYGRSMEEEARRILSQACAPGREPANAFDQLRRHFREIGGVDLELPARRPGRQPPDFD